MKWLTRTIFVTVAFLFLQGLAATAIQPSRDSTAGGPAVATSPDRQALVAEILGLWESAPNPINARNEAQYPDLRAALRAATTDQLLDAQKARTLDDLWAALPKGARNPITVVPLAAGRIPQVVSGLGADLVFTPVTPCRIIDTRGGIPPYAGAIGANNGNWFYVTGSSYANQGGINATCGIPLSPKPAAVAINITSTGQSGNGNLRVIQAGGGNPTVSLVNYVAGVNIANAAIVPSAVAPYEEIYICSSNSSSHVVVDILGYFSTPAATLPDNEVLYSDTLVSAGVMFSLYSPPCDTGYRLMGGGLNSGAWDGLANLTSSRPAQGASASLVSGTNTGDRWICQGVTGAATNIRCTAVCARIPGH